MAVGYHKLNSSAARSKRAARNDCAARAMIRDSTEALEIGNADLYGEGQWTGTPETADGSKAPLPGYPAGAWPTCQPVSEATAMDRTAALVGLAPVALLAATFWVVL